MTLSDVLAEVESRRKTITVYSSEDPAWIADQFATRNVTVEYEPLPADAPTGFVVVREAESEGESEREGDGLDGGEGADGDTRGDGDRGGVSGGVGDGASEDRRSVDADEGDGEGFVTSIGLPELREILQPPIRRPWEPPDGEYGAVFDLLDNTIFTTFDRRQLLGAAREIEDRAWRVGRGSLRVGFQRLSAMEDQVPVYATLGAETNLAIHVYGRDDWEPPAIPNVTVHATSSAEIGRFWFLAFDGDGEETTACALLAEERRPDRFYGFWTYDPELVAEVLDYLQSIDE